MFNRIGLYISVYSGRICERRKRRKRRKRNWKRRRNKKGRRIKKGRRVLWRDALPEKKYILCSHLLSGLYQTRCVYRSNTGLYI
jgi:hypothetical protein